MELHLMSAYLKRHLLKPHKQKETNTYSVILEIDTTLSRISIVLLLSLRIVNCHVLTINPYLIVKMLSNVVLFIVTKNE